MNSRRQVEGLWINTHAVSSHSYVNVETPHGSSVICPYGNFEKKCALVGCGRYGRLRGSHHHRARSLCRRGNSAKHQYQEAALELPDG